MGFFCFARVTIIIAFFTDRRRTVGQRRVAHQQRIARVHQYRRSEPHHEQHENVARPDAEHHQIRWRQARQDSGHVRSAHHIRATGPLLPKEDLPVRIVVWCWWRYPLYRVYPETNGTLNVTGALRVDFLEFVHYLLFFFFIRRNLRLGISTENETNLPTFLHNSHAIVNRFTR